MPAEAFDRADGEDALEIDAENLDPTRIYRWVHKRRLGRRRAQGYRVELRSESEIVLNGDDELLKSSERGSADDQYRVGDTFLMSCPKERRARRAKENFELTQKRLGVGVERFKQKGKKRGVRTLEGKEGDSGL